MSVDIPLVYREQTPTMEAALSLMRWDQEYVDQGFASTDWPGVETADNPWPLFPSIVHFHFPVKTRKASIPQALRWEVWQRDNFTCLHCGSRRKLSIDHIVAESKGGPTVLANLQTLCVPCNCRKGAR